jgi:hypothetical protein
MVWDTAKALLHVAAFIASIGLFLWIGRLGGRVITQRIARVWIRLPVLVLWAIAPPIVLMLAAGWPFSTAYQQTSVGFGMVLLSFHFLFWMIGTIWGANQASRR